MSPLPFLIKNKKYSRHSSIGNQNCAIDILKDLSNEIKFKFTWTGMTEWTGNRFSKREKKISPREYLHTRMNVHEDKMKDEKDLSEGQNRIFMSCRSMTPSSPFKETEF
jgi:hypothetical protein